MNKNFYLSVILVLLLGAFQSLKAQTYTITQDVSFTSPSNCFTEIVNTQESSWTSEGVTVDMTHNIFGNPTNPNLNNTVNNNGWRYIYFDIYEVNGSGAETFETTITKYSRILQGGISSGSSSITYNLDLLDLINANLSSGQKRIKVRFRMTLSNLSSTVNGFVEVNGVQECSATPLDGNQVTCQVGTTDCFTYYECGELDAVGYITQVPKYDKFGNFIGYTNEYTYNASLTGGSGSVVYNWSGPGSPNWAFGSTFTFIYPGIKPHVYLLATDLVTGCVYTWQSRSWKTNESAPGSELSLQVGPNPVASMDPITLRFNLPTADEFGVRIYDMSGKLIHDMTNKNKIYAGKHLMELDPQLNPGIYLVKLTTGEHGTKTTKLIVQ